MIFQIIFGWHGQVHTNVGNNFRWSRNCLRHFSNKGIFGAFLTQYLGLFNNTNNGNEANRVFAIELDTIQNIKLGDINNHVRIDINGLHSKKLAPAGYYAQNNGGFRNLMLTCIKFPTI
ncbi:hypothetical protein DVH24_004397 [Malus domestica]|uniref:Legume lectin domain-containing protein n=1 Tax=Malus domestica TaxID=3750 RepID=A0A498IGW2_MALDO|nr:hypothetical protein DVH24_004397 [Malus domestica]